jgi:ABC-type nickel/cobalt efflux system permease component RcnA
MIFSLVLLIISVVVLTLCLQDKNISEGTTAIWAFNFGLNLAAVISYLVRAC